MFNSDYQRQFSMETFRIGSSPHVAKKGYKDSLKASLKDFNIPTESREQTAQDREKLLCLIRKRAAKYEAMRICEYERKCKERQARTKGSSSE